MASFNIDSIIGDIFEKIYQEDVCDTICLKLFLPILNYLYIVQMQILHNQYTVSIIWWYFQFNLKVDVKPV